MYDAPICCYRTPPLLQSSLLPATARVLSTNGILTAMIPVHRPIIGGSMSFMDGLSAPYIPTLPTIILTIGLPETLYIPLKPMHTTVMSCTTPTSLPTMPSSSSDATDVILSSSISPMMRLMNLTLLTIPIGTTMKTGT